MNTTTIMIIVAVVIVWAVAFTVMLSLTKKRDAGEQKFIEENRDKALLHLYCKQIKVDGNSLANLSFTTGKNLQTIVALSGGQHTIEGVFETTESIGAKTRNIKTENMSFDVSLDAGHSYSAAMYFYSAEERSSYYKGEVGKAIVEVPLSFSVGSDYVKAYIIVYQEN